MERFIGFRDMIHLVLVGMNHRTASVALRERLACSAGGELAMTAELLRNHDIREAFALSTCNRVELLALARDLSGTERLLREMLGAGADLPPGKSGDCFYSYSGREAVRHLFRVTASLDSMVMGEPQILGQVKEAYRRSLEAGAAGLFINKLLHHSFRTAKRVRSETAIAANAVSVGSMAADLAKKIFGSLRKRTILIIGAGEMSELAAKHLMNGCEGRVVAANRSAEGALRIAEIFGGVAVGLDGIENALNDADIVISSAGASEFLITKAMVERAVRRRKNRLLFLIDIAVPRNIEPAAGSIDTVYLYNIDDLQEIVDQNLCTRKEEALAAEAIIEEEVQSFEKWYKTRDVVPTIAALRTKVEAVVREELMTALADSHGRPGSSIDVEALSRTITNKMLHEPIVGMKEECFDNGATYLTAAVRRLFRLDNE
ncbi:MAG: glutamyl-tRNA reductase [Deltaproteobacteria bacterium]|nr:glutamyl-tRNA reductase [Deltaproteobacteria bacterium]